ncbi:MAG: prepilin-type N-terminal cleavage/methylation domain-containing protein [Opitutaceae bacterium]|nr:prepilin-type N-terminal cleavage/methylation domain-containing protein [Opitutaceae bacterium]
MLPISSARRHQSGFTIIEVAMASFIMAFGLATSIITMQAGYKHIDLARGTTLAAQIIQSEMERIRMMSWTTVNALPSTATFDGATYFSSSSVVAGKYTITRTVTNDVDRPSEVKNINVAVRWQSYDLRWHQRAFSSIYAKNGLYDYYYTVAHP